jgi:hypothetical protein
MEVPVVHVSALMTKTSPLVGVKLGVVIAAELVPTLGT